MADTDRDDYRLMRRIASGRLSLAERQGGGRVAALVRRGLVEESGGAPSLTGVGRSMLRRHLASGDAFAAQHQSRSMRTVADDLGNTSSVLANDDESPLARLRRTRGRDGASLIGPDEYAAGERLRAEFTRGQLMPSITSSWSAAVIGRRRGGGNGGAAEMADAVVAARQRVDRALIAVGPDLAGVLLDFCCFLKGIEEIERERRWPARSAKLVIRLALASLARHYGLASTATGSPRAPIVHWGGEGYRPEIDPAG